MGDAHDAHNAEDAPGTGAAANPAHDRLVDLAINRAASYAQRLGALGAPPERLRERLELWYLRTRFAYRVPLPRVVAALTRHPGGEAHWRGGFEGGWRAGPAPRP